MTSSPGDSVRPSRPPGGQCGRTLLSGRTMCGTPELHRCIPLPAERLLGPHSQESSRDVCVHVHMCTCALGGVRWGGSQGRVPAERLLGPHPQESLLSFSEMHCQESPSMHWLKYQGTGNTHVCGKGMGSTRRGPHGRVNAL